MMRDLKDSIERMDARRERRKALLVGLGTALYILLILGVAWALDGRFLDQP